MSVGKKASYTEHQNYTDLPPSSKRCWAWAASPSEGEPSPVKCVAGKSCRKSAHLSKYGGRTELCIPPFPSGNTNTDYIMPSP